MPPRSVIQRCTFLSRRRFSSSPGSDAPTILERVDRWEKALTNIKWVVFGYSGWLLLASRKMNQSTDEVRDLADEKLRY